MIKQRNSSILVALLLIITLLGCDNGTSTSNQARASEAGSTMASVNRSFIGAVTGSNAFIAVVASKDKLMAYVCDGANDQVAISEWFKGGVSGDSFELTSAGGAKLRGKLGDTASGMVQLTDGRQLSFTTVAASSPAGLYRGEQAVGSSNLVGGWIVLNDGQQRGAIVSGNSRITTHLNIQDGTSNTIMHGRTALVHLAGFDGEFDADLINTP